METDVGSMQEKVSPSFVHRPRAILLPLCLGQPNPDLWEEPSPRERQMVCACWVKSSWNNSADEVVVVSFFLLMSI